MNYTGRLDKDSSGLIILTDDGRITGPLLDGTYEHEKEYLVTTKEKLRSNFKQKMENGVDIEGYVTKKCRVKILGENKFSVILTEGKKHQIRRMCANLFQEVDTLKRIRILNIELGKLSEGGHRRISGEELIVFLDTLGIKH
jgi:23S rRNA pseudouridine2604 synthase